MRELSHPALKVFLVLLSYRNASSARAYPGLEKIAKQSGFTRRTVYEAVEELIGAGLVEKFPQKRWQDSNRFTTNEYEVYSP